MKKWILIVSATIMIVDTCKASCLEAAIDEFEERGWSLSEADVVSEEDYELAVNKNHEDDYLSFKQG